MVKISSDNDGLSLTEALKEFMTLWPDLKKEQGPTMMKGHLLDHAEKKEEEPDQEVYYIYPVKEADEDNHSSKTSMANHSNTAETHVIQPNAYNHHVGEYSQGHVISSGVQSPRASISSGDEQLDTPSVYSLIQANQHADSTSLIIPPRRANYRT